MRKGKNEAGFTLLELLVVVTLIAIIAALAVPQYKNSVLKAKESVLKEDLYQFEVLIDQYYADKGKYPATLDALVEEGYLRRIPLDPITERRNTWELEYAEEDPLNPEAPPGIYDVRSGASGSGLNGIPYSEW